MNYSAWGVSWLDSWSGSWGPLHEVEEKTGGNSRRGLAKPKRPKMTLPYVQPLADQARRRARQDEDIVLVLL